MVINLKIIVIIKIEGYFGISKGIKKTPQTVLMVDKTIPINPTHKFMLIFYFDLSYNAPISPNAIIIYIIYFKIRRQIRLPMKSMQCIQRKSTKSGSNEVQKHDLKRMALIKTETQ